jgi:type IX secretion system PorP/SprF family membrane protein
MNKLLYISISIILFLSNILFAQETLPVYTDYLSDNVYLIHPSAAGIDNCSKVRLTGRQQWMDQTEAPQLQTFSFHTRLNNSGIGLAIFNDKNGYHSQIGGQVSYAYHINLGNRHELNQVSFGLSFMAVRNTLDEREFIIDDPAITQQINSRNYFNADAGISYHSEGLFSYFTAKNLLMSARNLYNDQYEDLNLRRYLISLGYKFGDKSSFQVVPSVMGQIVESTQRMFLDANLKAYYPFDNGNIWGGVSYRRGFDSGVYEAANYITPILGIEFDKYIFSYSYTLQKNDILFADGGYHQLTLGVNLFCDKKPGFEWRITE